MRPMSRREFAALTAGAFASPLAFTRPPGATVTAQAVVERVQKSAGVDWKPETVDTFKAGDPATVVTGIVTTSLATIDVLTRAVAAGANLVITSGPTFYARADNPAPPAGRGRAGAPGPSGATAPAPPAPPPTDRIYAAKHELIKKHNLVVWRFSDHWRSRKPDPLALGLTDAFGWAKFRAADDPSRVTIPAVTLDTLASDVKKKLNARGGVRVVGDPLLRVQRIGLLPGSTPIQAALSVMPAVDVIVAGEVREWESVEYARDKLTAGEKKGLILVGRVVSEDPGMNVCAQWLTTIVPEVKTTWIPVGDPYWRPV